jgi:hypothetical protein
VQPLARRLVDQGVDDILRDVGAAGGFADGVEGPFDPRVIGLVANVRGRHHEDGAKAEAENMVERAADLLRSSQMTTAKGPLPSSVRSA